LKNAIVPSLPDRSIPPTNFRDKTLVSSALSYFSATPDQPRLERTGILEDFAFELGQNPAGRASGEFATGGRITVRI